MQDFIVVVPQLQEYVDLEYSLGQYIEEKNADFIVKRLAVPVPIPKTKYPARNDVEDIALERKHSADVVMELERLKCIERSFQSSCRQTKLETEEGRKRRCVGFQPENDVHNNMILAFEKGVAQYLSPIHNGGDETASILNILSHQRSATLTNHCTLSSMPMEIKIEILRNLDCQSLINMSLVNARFCHYGREILEERFEPEMGAWVGKSITCLGYETRSNDLPKGTFSEVLKGLKKEFPYGDEDTTNDEEDAWSVDAEVGVDEDSDDDDDGDLEDTSPVIDFVSHVFGQALEPHLRFPKVMSKDFKGNNVEFLVGLCEIFKTSSLESKFYPNDQPWILRNLTKKEFVRADAIALRPEHIDGPIIHGVGFGEVVLIRTCWSPDKYTGLEVSDAPLSQAHRGVWAGDAFDITTVARHESLKRDETWTDVSDEVYRELQEIYKNLELDIMLGRWVDAEVDEQEEEEDDNDNNNDN